MKVFEAEGGTNFHFTNDLEDSVLIITDSQRVSIPGQDIKEFVAYIVKTKLIAVAEASTPDEILFG